MEHQLLRTEMLLGRECLERLKSCRVAVFGLGGVGGYAAEALARSGIGALDLIDPDRIALTNLNRQILALHSTIGQYKTEAAEARIHDIAPDCSVRTYNMFFLPDTADSLDFSAYDYVIDAVDTVTGKLAIVQKAQEAGVPVISVMGTGNKLDPSKLHAADLYETEVCPLARVMRRECRKRGIESLRVVYSTEEPVRPEKDPDADGEKRPESSVPEKRQKDVPGSSAFVPAAAGMIAAAEAVRTLCGRQ
ncbi:MAG: tRNA threonylcarbamoyladenosine dehydratase [Lachnospiraceae bacterium]|nr:tRNA threonylcarbamoyladenosine dehydratase [Lachnospiraceae bacterium]